MMRANANKTVRAWLALVVAAAGLAALTGSRVSAATPTINLCASTGQITMPDGVEVDVWGFVLLTTCAPGLVDGSAFPGPVIEVNEGDVVTINVDNALPAGHSLEFEIPGITFDPGPVDGSADITFTANDPGIYLYQSGGDSGRQEAMGLYGAFVVRPTSAPDTPIAGQAYHSAASSYDDEAILVLSQIDPSFNADPEGFDMKDYLATYWLIDGKAYDDAPSIPAAHGDKLLLRYVNAGYDNTSMSLLGAHERVIARDAHLLNNPFDATAETIPAGATEDAIVTVPAFEPLSANGFPLFNRNLHVTNGSGSTYATPGGMMTFIAPTD